MYKTISNKIIRKFNPKPDLLNVTKDDNEKLPVKQWVEKYRKVVPAEDIIWLLCRNEFLSNKDLMLFAVWCAREALKLIENPDERSVDACNVAERYVNGEATKEELLAARDAANAVYATISADYIAADVSVADKADITYSVAHAYSAAYYAAYAAYYSSYAADAAYIVSTDASIAAVYASFYTSYASYATDAANNTKSYYAALASAYTDVYAAARASQLDQLLTYFK
jgi:hypothetical protein